VAEDVIAFHLLDHDPPASLSCRELEEFIRSHNWSEFVQFLNEQGNIACYTSNLNNAFLPTSAEALRAARSNQHYFETISFTRGQPLRLLTYPVMSEGRLLDIVQVAESLEPTLQTLHDHRLLLTIYSPLLLVILSVGSWFVSGRTLSPVVQITSAVRRISAENLSQRLSVDSCQDEISDLQETFNSMLERLEESFNKVRQFTADASHELRTPLAILKGETEVTLRWARDADELRRTLESNMEEIDRMGRIIEDLLALAKSEAGEIPLAFTTVNLSDLLQDLYLQGKTLAEPKSIEFNLHLQVDREIYLRGDQLQLHRMLLNLVSNGVKYTPAGGKVEVYLATTDDKAQIRVVDTGFGIAEEHFPYLFDRFYRIDEARNRDIGGSGLGLSIVKWIVDAHGGTIEVKSELNKGSEFAVTLPLGGPVLKTDD
jgi:heavy metal sensor kinase